MKINSVRCDLSDVSARKHYWCAWCAGEYSLTNTPVKSSQKSCILITLKKMCSWSKYLVNVFFTFEVCINRHVLKPCARCASFAMFWNHVHDVYHSPCFQTIFTLCCACVGAVRQVAATRDIKVRRNNNTHAAGADRERRSSCSGRCVRLWHHYVGV